jgi:hypothetical protein
MPADILKNFLKIEFLFLKFKHFLKIKIPYK